MFLFSEEWNSLQDWRFTRQKYTWHQNLFSLYFCKRRTTTAQKDPSHMTGKPVGYIMHVRRLKKQFGFKDSSIITMDETSVWNDMVSSTTDEQAGAKELS